ncbi:MAG: hypothetical protein COB02_10580 [Candidatus Cloacimonadota bacterium]|nr:MAG: hypothetical protein COB02_10580 [Candidatus Cloacimonadota bacterium]
MTKFWYLPAVVFFLVVSFSGCMKPSLEDEINKYLNKDTLWINKEATILSDQFEQSMISLATDEKATIELLKSKLIKQSENYLSKLKSHMIYNDKIKNAHEQIIICAKYTDLGYKFVLKNLETKDGLYHKQATEVFDKADQAQRIWKQRILDLGQKFKVEIK